MRKLFSVSLLLCLLSTIYAQDSEFLFENELGDTLRYKINYAYAGTHTLGTEVARKMMLLQETYTHIEKGTSMSPGEKTIVTKPEIFYSVKKLNTYYKKAVKKGIIDEEEAAKSLISVVNKSFSILYQDTEKFEAYLKKQKKPEEIQKAFDLIKLY